MILQALTAYYYGKYNVDQVADRNIYSQYFEKYFYFDRKDELPQPLGWEEREVKFNLQLSLQGELLGVVPVGGTRGLTRTVPLIERTSNKEAKFLCDNARYLLGVSSRQSEDVSALFSKAKNKHLSLLRDVETPAAEALCAFFETWEPENAADNAAIKTCIEELKKGGNCEFSILSSEGDKRILDDIAVCNAWNYELEEQVRSSKTMSCLVEGTREPVALTHPSIKGIKGARANAKLVAFNESAFKSHGNKDKGFNAPVSVEAAFAYSAALNYLLSCENHRVNLGDTTVVYWADRCDNECTRIYTDALNLSALSVDEADKVVNDIMVKISRGEHFENIDVNANFFILGLAPINESRISARFFLRSRFDSMLKNLQQHYERINIAHSASLKEYLSPKNLIWETLSPGEQEKTKKERKYSKANAARANQMLISIINNSSYPHSLYTRTLTRIYAAQEKKVAKRDESDDIKQEKDSHKVSRTQAAIIKAILMKNYGEEELTVELNENSESIPYSLGRLFSLVVYAQEKAAELDNRELNTTILNRYFNAASMTPASVFPAIMRLNLKHLEKLKDSVKSTNKDNKKSFGLYLWLDQEIAELSNRIGQSFPNRLTVQEQGEFILGYWGQKNRANKSKEE